MPTLPLALPLGPAPAALLDSALANSCSALRSRRRPPDSRRFPAMLPRPSGLPASAELPDSGLAAAAPPRGAAAGGVAGSDAAYSALQMIEHRRGGRSGRATWRKEGSIFEGAALAGRPASALLPSPVTPETRAAQQSRPSPGPDAPSAADAVRDTPGEVRRRAADTEAQCTAASYAPDPCSVSSEPLSAARGTEWGA